MPTRERLTVSPHLPSLRTRFDRYAAANAAFAGAAAALLGAGAAHGEIVYSGAKNVPVPAGGKGLFIDFDSGTFSTTEDTAGFDLNFTEAGGSSTTLSIATPKNGIDGVEGKVVTHKSSSSSSSSVTTNFSSFTTPPAAL